MAEGPGKIQANLARVLCALALLLVVALGVFLLREPRAEGMTASEWLEAAQRDQQNLHRYGKVFISWDERGARFLVNRVRTDVIPAKRRILDFYNSVAKSVGLSEVPVAPATTAERDTARRLLGYFEVDAVGPLAALLDTTIHSNRVAALQAMSELGPRAASELAPLLIPLLDDSSVEIQYEAITALAATDAAPEIVLPRLIPFLTNSLDRARVEASYALGSYPSSPGLTLVPLSEVLNDSNGVVQANALRALGKSGSAATMVQAEMFRLLGDSSGLVQARAVEALSLVAAREELQRNTSYRSALERGEATADPYSKLMYYRAQLPLDGPPLGMESACGRLLVSPSNWQVWEAVDALAELRPRPEWAAALLQSASRHPNGTVRAKAQAALRVSR